MLMEKNGTYSFDLDGGLISSFCTIFYTGSITVRGFAREILQESLDYLIHKNCNSKYTKKGILIWGFLYSKLACLLNSS